MNQKQTPAAGSGPLHPLVRASRWAMLVYRLFYRVWNPLLAARPDLWDRIRGDPARPLYVHGDMRKMLDYRTGRCAGCEWHPDVCDHCLRSVVPDFDEGAERKP